MFFNSLDFAVFLPIVFLLYWFVVNNRLWSRNLFILLVSYVFYGWWDYRFLALILFSTITDYAAGLMMGRTTNPLNRKLLLWLSLFINLGLLGFFKYYNFFVDSFSDVFTVFGREFRADRLNIVLPVGISFYTFQTLSYTIDVYRKKLEPTRDFIAFGAFVSFFPQLVAGPIERASNLLPQFSSLHRFNYQLSVDGLRQILWGLFKKIVIADNCAEIANQIFSGYTEYSGSTLVVGAVFFAVQIYGDFSGYSDIAIGTARLFGFNLMRNFANPYFSRDIAEFWRRWHISLSTWFRDYLYIPLGGSRGSTARVLRNTFIIFIVSGFWHGANWTFIAWGALNALFFIPLLLRKVHRKNLYVVAEGKRYPSGKEVLSMAGTFALTTLAWIFFRAESIGQAIHYLSMVLSASLFTIPHFPARPAAITTIILVAFFFLIEWSGRSDHYAIEKFGLKVHRIVRYGIYYLIIFLIFWFSGSEQQFIYFQF